MSAGLTHPILISTELNLDQVMIGGQMVEFRHVFYTWVVLGFLIILGLVVKRRLKMVPTGTQNVLETVIDGLEDFIIGNMGEAGRKFIPLLSGIFIYILCMNLTGLLPGFDAPTANINTTASMALFVFVYYNYLGIKSWGSKYIHHFTGPMPLMAPMMLPLEIVSHMVRPLSLALRLFGNIRGEELVLLIFFTLAPVFATLPLYFLFGLAKTLQAFIFFMLTMIYIKGAIEHAH